jgi:hypothetical protein
MAQSAMEKKRDNLYQTLATKGADIAAPYIDNPLVIAQMMNDLTAMIYDEFRGQNISFPMERPPFVTPVVIEATEMWRKLPDNNLAPIASHFNVTERTVRRWLDIGRKLIANTEQPGLF